MRPNLRIAFFNSRPEEQITRQLEDGAHKWQGAIFSVNENNVEADCVVVYEGVCQDINVVVPPGNVFFICGEPPKQKKYHPEFLAQFARVLTSDAQMAHPGRVLGQLGLPWGVGIRRQATSSKVHQIETALADLAGCERPTKTKLVSVVCSNVVRLDGHRLRQDFAAELMSVFGADVDVFGRGFQPIADKWDAIAPYRFHISLENSSVPHYWTEKLSDAYLGYAAPVYWGAPNILEYYREEEIIRVALRNPRRDAKRLRDLLTVDEYERRIPAIERARTRTLYEYNTFEIVRQFAARHAIAGERQRVLVRPEHSFGRHIGALVNRVARAIESSPRRLRRKLGITPLQRAIRSRQRPAT